ncbi:GDSL-type esterase/lipase family protein [Halalkalibaculum sp. DA3122]|uniref:GDSL-type esterase/lipase family protein n=1 Tax=Halalkalibaculum sp. DA3122 TaxID=3373607 RepID=UPI00375429A7
MLQKYLLCFIICVFAGDLVRSQPVGDPDPQRFQQQIETFLEWDAKNTFPEDAILFVGSSSIRFWKTRRAFPEYPVINRGFGGSHISDVRHFYKHVIHKYEPSVIVFYAGDNDVAADKPVEQVVDDYRNLTERVLTDFPEVKFVYIPIKPSSSRWNYWERMEKVNRRIKSYNQQYEQLFYVDLATPLLKNGKPDDSLFMEDLLHLNEKGYAAWNRVLAPALDTLY